MKSHIQKATTEFNSKFRREPSWIAVAPGRVNLIGEHVDYNDGFVLPMAIERYVVIAAAQNQDTSGLTNIFSLSLQECHSVDLSQPLVSEKPQWHSYFDGVIDGFKKLGLRFAPFDAIISSNVPVGSGLSSSAALEVAIATLIEAMTGKELSKRDKALLCQRAEREFAGVPCGIMDQFSSVYGQTDRLMLLDCRSQEIELIPFSASEVTVLIADSKVQHEHGGGEYAERRRQCEKAAKCLGVKTLRDATIAQLDASGELDPKIYRRAKHVITEIERTQQVAEAIRAGNWKRAGQLMYQSHVSMRDDFEISCSEIDLLVEIASGLGESSGVYGSRMTGGGFGGCTVSLVKTDQVSQVAKTISNRYREATEMRASIFSSRAAAGAQLIVNP